MIKVLGFHTVHSKRLPNWGSIHTKLTFGVHASASPTNADDSVLPSSSNTPLLVLDALAFLCKNRYYLRETGSDHTVVRSRVAAFQFVKWGKKPPIKRVLTRLGLFA